MLSVLGAHAQRCLPPLVASSWQASPLSASCLRDVKHNGPLVQGICLCHCWPGAPHGAPHQRAQQAQHAAAAKEVFVAHAAVVCRQAGGKGGMQQADCGSGEAARTAHACLACNAQLSLPLPGSLPAGTVLQRVASAPTQLGRFTQRAAAAHPPVKLLRTKP